MKLALDEVVARGRIVVMPAPQGMPQLKKVELIRYALAPEDLVDSIDRLSRRNFWLNVASRSGSGGVMGVRKRVTRPAHWGPVLAALVVSCSSGMTGAASSMRSMLDETLGKGKDGVHSICKDSTVEESSWDFEGKPLSKLACHAGAADVTFFFGQSGTIIKASATVLSR